MDRDHTEISRRICRAPSKWAQFAVIIRDSCNHHRCPIRWGSLATSGRYWLTATVHLLLTAIQLIWSSASCFILFYFFSLFIQLSRFRHVAMVIARFCQCVPALLLLLLFLLLLSDSRFLFFRHQLGPHLYQVMEIRQFIKQVLVDITTLFCWSSFLLLARLPARALFVQHMWYGVAGRVRAKTISVWHNDIGCCKMQITSMNK